MREDYKAARKLGEDAVRKAVRNGVSPYLPVLDALDEIKQSVGQTGLGLLELPISRIKGNKELARNNAFANNFMPLMDEDSEFGYKWSNLYDSYRQEGIRDAIKVYEYMNQYYVQEGNKRVSVSKFGGTDFILADVIRILPRKNDSKEVRVYYEYLDFYKVTKNFLIVFSELGEYAKLAELMGQDLEHEWPEDVRKDLKSAFFRFSKNIKTNMKIEDEFVVSDAFLVYISIFPIKTLLEDSDDQILKNIKLAQSELASGGNLDNIAFLDNTPSDDEKQQQSSIMNLFSKTRKYTSSAPLKVGFIYDNDVDHSRWIDSHEAGRLYVDEMTDNNVSTKDYYLTSNEDISDTLNRAIKDKNEIIFAVSPSMSQAVLQAAVHHPEVKFLNCSLAQNYTSLRCYHGKLYEATFLMGILTANMMLMESSVGEKRSIGYVSRSKDAMNIINLNAFAIGVSIIDPECRIMLKYVNDDNENEYRQQMIDDGIKFYADFEYSEDNNSSRRPGVFRIEGERDAYIGSPYFNWGKYYVKIVQSVLSGTWDLNQVKSMRTAANYWFGLSTGVVDIRTPKLPYQTAKMLSFFEKAIIDGDLDPFSGEIHAQNDRKIQGAVSSRNSGVSAQIQQLSAGNIVSINWFNDNIYGEIPEGE